MRPLWWDRLGDDELWARLVNRGITDYWAHRMVRHRESDDCDCRSNIHDLLDRRDAFGEE